MILRLLYLIKFLGRLPKSRASNLKLEVEATD